MGRFREGVEFFGQTKEKSVAIDKRTDKQALDRMAELFRTKSWDDLDVDLMAQIIETTGRKVD